MTMAKKSTKKISEKDLAYTWAKEPDVQAEALQKQASAIERDLVAVLRDEWLERGGCTRCGGTGMVLGWSTLDGEGWDEWGQCPECKGASTEQTGGAGFSPDRRDAPCSSRGNMRHWIRPNIWAGAPKMHTEYEAIMSVARSLKLESDERIESLKPYGGKRVRIVAGRKYKHGTEGTCFWCGDTRYGRSCGFKLDGSETAEWTAERNVIAIDMFDKRDK
jgi:hypothetical protein